MKHQCQRGLVEEWSRDAEIAAAYAEGFAAGMADGLVAGAEGEWDFMREVCMTCGWERIAGEALKKLGIKPPSMEES